MTYQANLFIELPWPPAGVVVSINATSMNFSIQGLLYLILLGSLASCQPTAKPAAAAQAKILKPILITEPTPNDTDDPAIWIHPTDPAQSIIVGTDKGDTTGGLYVFELSGKIDIARSVIGLHRPNNVDIEYGLTLGDSILDISVCTERGKNTIRVFRLPDMQAIDGGGIPVFENDSLRAPMGIALYKRPHDQAIFAYVSRKTGPQNGYLGIYQLSADSNGIVTAKWIGNRGAFSGKKEIEAICVDDSLGFIFYSDEMTGIRKYHADPDSSDEELAFFGGSFFTEDVEGISILPTDSGKGYLLVSDQQADKFQVFDRLGAHEHLGSLAVSTRESDGSETTVQKLGRPFEKGLFVAMSDDRTFQFYTIDSLLQAILWD